MKTTLLYKIIRVKKQKNIKRWNQQNYQVVITEFCYTVEPRYNEDIGTMKITLLYQVSHYIRVKELKKYKELGPANDLVIRGFCYIQPLYNEVPLYLPSL